MRAALQGVFAGLLAVTCCSTWPTAAQTWTLTSAPAAQDWWSLCSSADGTKLAAVGYFGTIYTSTNSGVTWSPTGAPSGCWQAIACSADGATLLAAMGSYLYGCTQALFLSYDSGFTWVQANAPTYHWSDVASSADGTRLVAVGGDYPTSVICLSSDSGMSWAVANAPNQPWASVAISADGIRIAASSWEGTYTSTNAGLDWVSSGNPSPGGRVALSADGTELAVITNSTLWLSADWGSTWASTVLDVWAYGVGNPQVAICSDGNTVLTIGGGQLGGIGAAISTNFGAAWLASLVSYYGNTNPCAIASSADGTKLVAAVGGFGIFSWRTTPRPILNITNSGQNLLLSWVVPSQPFVLQQSSDLLTWSSVGASPTINYTNLHYELSITRSDEVGFFRLKSE